MTTLAQHLQRFGADRRLPCSAPAQVWPGGIVALPGQTVPMDLAEKDSLGVAAGSLKRHPWEQARAQLLCAWVKDHNLTLGNVLDVGCGDAYILQRLAEDNPGCHCLGIDSAYVGPEDFAPNIRMVASLDQVPESQQAATIILLMDVLEHVEDDLAMVRGLLSSTLVDQNTVFFVTVPAFQGLFSGHDTWLGHFRRYNLKRLRTMLAAGGLEALDQGYWFTLPMFVRILEVILEKTGLRKFRSTGVVSWRLGATLTRWIRNVLMLDVAATRFVARRFGFHLPGLTCYAACRPKSE